MDNKDYYEKLLGSYEFLFGRLQNREEFKKALQHTLSEEDVRIILCTPFYGEISVAALEKRIKKIGIPPIKLKETFRRLIPEGFIASYIKAKGPYPANYQPMEDLQHKDRVVARGHLIVMAEMQVRKQNNDPMRAASANYMNLLIEDGLKSMPTKTPGFRVLPVEETITQKTKKKTIPINKSIPPQSAVLPIDIVSEMIRKEELIAVADCFCRSTKQIVGDPCPHPLETCFYFNDLARIQLETKRARLVSYDEAIDILYRCEEIGGMVHNVSNAKQGLSSLCNCCACSCVAMRALMAGGTNAISTSRFITHHDKQSCDMCELCVDACPIQAISLKNEQIDVDLERCIGCGQCAYKCPQQSMHMIPRQKPPKIYNSWDSVNRRMMIEALFSLVRQKVTI